MNRSTFGSSKDIMIEGKDLDLKFMCDCRCHLKLDKSKKEYVFNDEDRLIFAIKGSSFWDDYCKCDRVMVDNVLVKSQTELVKIFIKLLTTNTKYVILDISNLE